MSSRSPAAFELALAGDVMLGRGVDQLLPHPSSPEIFEDYLHDARDYVELAEQKSGPIPRPVAFEYPWGDALADLRRADLTIVNLETSVTSSDDAWPDKGINYRMHPKNVGSLVTAGIDVVTLANNHLLDWGRRGLAETVDTLRAAGVTSVGAGRSSMEAEAAVACNIDPERRVVVLAVAEPGSGVPLSWEAKVDLPGVALVRDLDASEADAIARRVDAVRRKDDLVVVSIHWGSNWGYAVEEEHVRFAHALIERGIDIVFGHSSHHPRPIELHRGKPILYGCGDLLDDYEGISGYEPFKNDLVLLWLVRIEGRDIELRMKPFRLRRMRLETASAEESAFLERTLDEWSRPLGTRIFTRSDGSFGACAV